MLASRLSGVYGQLVRKTGRSGGSGRPLGERPVGGVATRSGARWGLAGAEAILKLRAIKANGDFDAHWRYHLAQERHHVHEARYLNHATPSVT